MRLQYAKKRRKIINEYYDLKCLAATGIYLRIFNIMI